MYYLEDYSLGEISELLQVSRQAVYDNIKRTETMLESYEKKLHLFDKFQQRATLLNKLDQAIEDDDYTMRTLFNQLKELD